jgi:D-alanyl-D-alanine carboxypeptidase
MGYGHRFRYEAAAMRMIAFACCVAVAVGAPPDRTDEFIASEMQKQRIPGLSLVVIKEGKVVKAAGYGLADVAGRRPATAETVYKIGSVSKQFIATGIMLLVQDRRLDLEAPVSMFLEATPPTWSRIRIRHLLTHTAGLVREAPGFDWKKVQSDADVIKSAYPLPLRFEPGAKWEYSNVGYFALAEIIRKVSGQAWEVFLDARVFGPSGMRATHATNTKAALANRAIGYTDNDSPRPVVEWAALRPSGAFLSTVQDLARWDAVWEADRVLSDASRRQMTTPVTLADGSSHGYGFGWHVGVVHGHKAMFHGGGLPGFAAQYIRFVDARLTIAILLNMDDADDQSIVHGVAAIHLPSS